MEIPWVTCRFPSPSLAQDAEMSDKPFEDFLFGAVLLDWDAEGEKMKRIKDRFDEASDVRIVGAETDLRFSLEGRDGEVDDGHANMPGGEVFYSPVLTRPRALSASSSTPPTRSQTSSRAFACGTRAARSSRPLRRATRRR